MRTASTFLCLPTEKEELEGGVHALSMVLKTPEQWRKIENDPEQLQKFKSPPCAGGSGK